MWKRFVDVISVIKRGKEVELLQYLNKRHDHIQFTMEKEDSGSLPFMDVRFTRMSGGQLKREVFQKPTHSNRYIQCDSHHPSSIKSRSLNDWLTVQ